MDMNRYVLFLNGRYRTADLPYYRKFLHSARTVAVDNGYAFFKKIGRYPHVLIGDFDSLRKVPNDLPASTEIHSFPREKDKSDAELALEFAVGRKANSIDIIQPTTGDVDHFIANLMLLDLPALKKRARRKPTVRIVGRRYQIWLVENESLALTGMPGETLSVIPLSQTIRMSCSGMHYPADNIRIRRGQALPLRNVFSRRKALVTVGGQAFVVHLLGK
jgi:thiamine pyrophosphokinase